MEELSLKVAEYKKENDFSNEDCAKKLNVSVGMLNDILSANKELNISIKERKRIWKIVSSSTSQKGKNAKFVVKILDLSFRFVAMVMALVTLLLCINENVDVKSLIVLLSIGLVCSSMTLLPKID